MSMTELKKLEALICLRFLSNISNKWQSSYGLLFTGQLEFEMLLFAEGGKLKDP